MISARTRAGLMFLLAALSWLALSGSLHGDFVWDDQVLIAHNPLLRGADAWRHAATTSFFDVGLGPTERASTRQMFRPFVSVAYAVEFQLFGTSTTGYHIVNLVLHIACVLMVFLWIERRLGSMAAALPAAFFGAAVFAVHPSRAESVAWISGCTDVWMTFWVLVGLTAWQRTRGIPGALATGVAFTVALFCKEIAIVAPAAVLVDAWLRRAWLPLARTVSLLAVAAGSIALRLMGAAVEAQGGVKGGLFSGLWRVIATLGGYLKIFLWPWPASTQVGYLASAVTNGPAQYPAWGFLIGLAGITLAITALLLLSDRRTWLADATWFLLPIAPVLNFVPVTVVYYVAERHIYFAAIGVAALIARLMSRLWETRWRTAASVAAAALLIAYGVGAAVHARHFRSADQLWTYETRLRPDDWVAVRALFHIRLEAHRDAEARPLAEHLMELVPGAEDKAAALADWLEVDLDDATGKTQAAIDAVRKEYDAIAAHGEPPGRCGQLYATIAESGRKWLRRSSRFRFDRARAALAAGDFGSTVRQLEALRQDGGFSEGAERDEVAALAAQGDMPQVQSMLGQLPPAEAAALSPLASSCCDNLALATTIANVDVPEVALALTRKGLRDQPDSVDWLKFELDVLLKLHRYEDARTVHARLKAVAPQLAIPDVPEGTSPSS